MKSWDAPKGNDVWKEVTFLLFDVGVRNSGVPLKTSSSHQRYWNAQRW